LHRGALAPSASNPKVPKELDEIVLKALSIQQAQKVLNSVHIEQPQKLFAVGR
jgi:hypothetical protein